MKSLKFAAVAMAAFAVSAAGVALAQDYSQQPAYGSVSLQAGFLPDPFLLNVDAGGGIDASRTIGCAGFVAVAPDFRLNYAPGSYPLTIGAVANGDTTIVINAPDGSWYCDDDSGGDLNPAVTFNQPMGGQYDIWVGTYSSGSLIPAQIVITEQ
jgi:hypothetical protein